MCNTQVVQTCSTAFEMKEILKINEINREIVFASKENEFVSRIEML